MPCPNPCERERDNSFAKVSSMPLQIALIGATGRTGRAVAAAASEHEAIVVSALTRRDDLNAGIRRAEVVLDFSSHEVTARVIELAVRHGKPLVIGTTGHSAAEKDVLLRQAARVRASGRATIPWA